MGESFARGHKEASGGIVPVPEFEELMALMGVGQKPDSGTAGAGAGAGAGAAAAAETGKAMEKRVMTSQKNNLLNYFEKK